MEKINPEDVRIGLDLHHRDKGYIVVEGISPHCGDYKIDYSLTDDEGEVKHGWVYLKNCVNITD